LLILEALSPHPDVIDAPSLINEGLKPRDKNINSYLDCPRGRLLWVVKEKVGEMLFYVTQLCLLLTIISCSSQNITLLSDLGQYLQLENSTEWAGMNPLLIVN
jgi:hypothetical protein